MLFDYWPWAIAWLLVFCWALHHHGLTTNRIPLLDRQVYRRDSCDKLFIYQERAGFNNVRQDWWHEIQMCSPTEFCLVGDWFKHNVGYYSNKHPVETFPYLPAPRREVIATAPVPSLAQRTHAFRI